MREREREREREKMVYFVQLARIFEVERTNLSKLNRRDRQREKA